MGDDFLFTVCCPSCGAVISKSFRGARTYTRCSKCNADLYYEITENGTIVKITKKPKNFPEVPPVPA